ncbi:hypothetical protein CAL12_20610 [Bordetella genomosp. 8]|uniref:Uncharacterized protein n=1 Tax=Bordetella genomosp. 8 TaxID=1416806 RepID=A0A1W6YPG0_9BORD|nr:hypothetical protein CAL12_20610 [Bordetella genomosp. 8]
MCHDISWLSAFVATVGFQFRTEVMNPVEASDLGKLCLDEAVRAAGRDGNPVPHMVRTSSLVHKIFSRWAVF